MLQERFGWVHGHFSHVFRYSVSSIILRSKHVYPPPPPPPASSPGVSCTKKEVLESSNYLYLFALIMRLDLDGASAQLEVVDLTSCAVVN